jgi:hypothetical protein
MVLGAYGGLILAASYVWPAERRRLVSTAPMAVAGGEDAGAAGQAVAVKREAERAFPEHYGSGSVAGITASLHPGQIRGADCGAGMDLKAEETRTAAFSPGPSPGLGSTGRSSARPG